MTARIIDTNIWIAASGKADHAGETCTDRCSKWLSEFARSTDSLVIDEASLENHEVPGLSVLAELRRNIREGWVGHDVLNRLYRDFRFEPMPIRYDRDGAIIERLDDQGDLEQIDEKKLPGFESADRKWVALHFAHPERPPIHNALDGDWLKQWATLRRLGVALRLVCRERLVEIVTEQGVADQGWEEIPDA